jgi:ABC-type transport system substrate-binding protein
MPKIKKFYVFLLCLLILALLSACGASQTDTQEPSNQPSALSEGTYKTLPDSTDPESNGTTLSFNVSDRKTLTDGTNELIVIYNGPDNWSCNHTLCAQGVGSQIMFFYDTNKLGVATIGKGEISLYGDWQEKK